MGCNPHIFLSFLTFNIRISGSSNCTQQFQEIEKKNYQQIKSFNNAFSPSTWHSYIQTHTTHSWPAIRIRTPVTVVNYPIPPSHVPSRGTSSFTVAVSKSNKLSLCSDTTKADNLHSLDIKLSTTQLLSKLLWKKKLTS